jgi:hypothetical protein
VLGVQALAPGWKRAAIQPHSGGLDFAEGRVPTPRGPILVAWKRGKSFSMTVTLPESMTATAKIPAPPGSDRVCVGGHPVRAHRENGWWILDEDIAGTAVVETSSGPHLPLPR